MLSSKNRWCFSAVLGWELVVVLLSSLRRAHSAQFNIILNSTANITLDVQLGDTITIDCPQERYDRIHYLSTREQLRQCNVSALPTDYQSQGHTYIHVGSCAGRLVSSFDIEIRRTSEFLETSVPFQNGGTYHFTSFTDGTLSSVASSPTAGGDCTKGLSLILNVIDPNATMVTPLPTTIAPTSISEETAKTNEPSIIPIKEFEGEVAALEPASLAPSLCVSSLLVVPVVVSLSLTL